MMPNERTVTMKITRRDLCNCIEAVRFVKYSLDDDGQTRWGELGEKLKQILNEFDEKLDAEEARKNERYH